MRTHESPRLLNGLRKIFSNLRKRKGDVPFDGADGKPQLLSDFFIGKPLFPAQQIAFLALGGHSGHLFADQGTGVVRKNRLFTPPLIA